jgi:hypothetical protein
MTILCPAARLRGGLARLLVVALVVSSAAPLLHDEQRHDTDCDPVLIVHDASQHRIVADEPRQPVESGEHCSACHWARALRSLHLDVAGSPPRVAGTLLAWPTLTSRISRFDLRVPARAPPSVA